MTSSINIQASPCICCEGLAIAPHFEGLLRCSRCGHVRADLDWSSDQFRQLYGEHYFKGGEYEDYEREGPALARNFRKRVKELAARHPGGGRLWEIGCAYGFFLLEASASFDAAGCDVAEDAVQNAVTHRGVNSRCLDYLSYQADHEYDVICMWDTIEHLPEPQHFLEKAFKDLAVGGTLALSTGDIGSLCARIRGRHWRLIHPPTHVHYFTRDSMRALLTRIGFSDIEIHYPAFWRGMDGVVEKLIGNAADPDHLGQRLCLLLNRWGLLRFSFPMNLFDLMTVYARKR